MNKKPQEQAALGLVSWFLGRSLLPWLYASVIHTVLFSLSLSFLLPHHLILHVALAMTVLTSASGDHW